MKSISLILFLSFMFSGSKEIDETYTLLYFYSPDCPSCIEIAPYIDYLQETYGPRIYRFNTRNPVGQRYAMQNRIRYVPTLILKKVSDDNKVETHYYEGIEEIKEAESRIADLSSTAIFQ